MWTYGRRMAHKRSTSSATLQQMPHLSTQSHFLSRSPLSPCMRQLHLAILHSIPVRVSLPIAIPSTRLTHLIDNLTQFSSNPYNPYPNNGPPTVNPYSQPPQIPSHYGQYQQSYPPSSNGQYVPSYPSSSNGQHTGYPPASNGQYGSAFPQSHGYQSKRQNVVSFLHSESFIMIKLILTRLQEGLLHLHIWYILELQYMQ
jgi:hypothetical protein